ncbi:MAG TPA: NAD(P)H-dependent oxidoreductase [Burkholderiales bacterium]|nr:NAD(P)H-dependent oxidoreductase [Burkholderiales bacterium]
MKIAIITGSTRPGRNNIAVARWVFQLAATRRDANFELVDIADYHLPLLDEPLPPALGRYSHEHTKRWAAKIASFDGYVFVVPEYNHGTSAALKNALDYLYAEWNDKAAGFVSYGAIGGARAVEHLRTVMGNLKLADVTTQVMLSLFTDFENMAVFRPDPRHEAKLHVMLDEVIGWAGALRGLRLESRAVAA